MAGSPLLSRFSLSAISATYSWADMEHENYPTYLGNLTGSVAMTRNLPSLFAGIQADRSATVELSNVNQAIGTAGSEYGTVNGELDGYGDDLYGGSGDPTLSEITASEDIRGRFASLAITDTEANVDLISFFGQVTNVSLGMKTAQVTIQTTDAEMFTELVPKKRLLDVYPNADLSNSSDQDVPVIVPFGTMRKVSLNQVYGGSPYDYGLMRKPSAGSLWLDTVYRDSRVISRAEWNLVESPTNYYVVRFEKDQRDFSNALMSIQVDIESSEWTRPSEVVKFILTDTTYGLRATASNGSFNTAKSDYATLGYVVNGGLDQRRTASDVINDLCLHGAWLDKNNSGAYRIFVDQSSRHVPGTPSLGVGDNQWENVNADSIKQDFIAIDQRTRALTINGLYDRGFSGTATYLLKANRNRLESGVETEVSNPYIGDATTLDKEVDYRFKRLIYADSTITLDAALEARTLDVENIVALYIPNLNLSGTQYEIRGMTFNKGATSPGQVIDGAFNFTLGGYNSAAFTYTPGTVQAAPSASTTTDYSLTPPGAVTGFSVTSSTNSTTGTVQIETIFNLTATAPSVNVTHLVFEIFKSGGAIPLQVSVVTVLPSGAATAAFSVAAGNTYDLQCFARNVNNNANAEDGPPSILAGQGAPNAPGAPATPAAPTVTQGTGKSIRVSWTANTETNISGYQVWRNTTNNSGTSSLIATVSATPDNTSGNKIVYVDNDSALAYGFTYYYWIKAFNSSFPNQSGQISGFSSVGNLAAPLSALGTSDYTALSVTGAIIANATITDANIHSATITGASIANATITDANISSLSAAKITTGLLTVNPSSGGATAIFIDNAGKIRLKSNTSGIGSASKIVFENGSSTEQFEISGGSSPAAAFQPSSDNSINLFIGQSSLHWATITVYSQGIIELNSGVGVKIIGDFRLDSGNFLTASVSGTQNKVWTLQDSTSSIVGYIPIYTTHT